MESTARSGAFRAVRADHWTILARQWQALGPPLRPSVEDISIQSEIIQDWRQSHAGQLPTALVLGVTQELCALGADCLQRVIAVEKSANMIRALWNPGAPQTEVLCSDWRNIPLPDASMDLALADGAFTTLQFPSGYQDVCAELHRLVRPGGRCGLRCFVQLAERETVENVFAELSKGCIGNFHILKWRLAMALQAEPRTGVALGEVWETVDSAWPQRGLLSAEFDWPANEVHTIEAYRNVATLYSFPTLDEHLDLFSSVGFRVLRVVAPKYELGERCPTIVLERP